MVTHDVTDVNGKAWIASPISSGASWSLTAQESAAYYCSFHPVMKGEIVVE
jgi:plastocyanin